MAGFRCLRLTFFKLLFMLTFGRWRKRFRISFRTARSRNGNTIRWGNWKEVSCKWAAIVNRLTFSSLGHVRSIENVRLSGGVNGSGLYLTWPQWPRSSKEAWEWKELWLYFLSFLCSHDVAEVAGLTSFSFGEDEESRYVMLFKKVPKFSFLIALA